MQKSRKNKKAQVALFVTIAVVIIAAVSLILILRPGIRPVVKELAPDAYIKAAAKDAARGAIDILSVQGGILEPTHYKLYNNNKVRYLCYTNLYYTKCVNQQPLLKQFVEKEITSYVLPIVEEKIEKLKTDLINKGYEVRTEGSLDLITRIEPGKVVIDIDYPITITKGEVKTRYEKFQAVLPSPLYRQIMLTEEIINQEIRWGNFDHVGYMIFRWEDDIIRDRVDETTIYTLKDKNTEKEFIFAIRNYVMPAGI